MGKLFNMINDENLNFKSFKKPWHGQVFAITVSLSEKKLFDWKEFSHELSNQIKSAKTENQSGGDDYFCSWIKALENIIINKKIVNRDNLTKTKKKWKEAFLTTPHGMPVKIVSK